VVIKIFSFVTFSLLLSVCFAKDISLQSDCHKKVLGKGKGFMSFRGIEFNQKKKKCVYKTVSGSSLISAFKTIRDCRLLCERPFAIHNLIKKRCVTIKVDLNGNTCDLGEEKKDYTCGCTEMVSTQNLVVPQCVKYNNK
jgi:hypothetical protein